MSFSRVEVGHLPPRLQQPCEALIRKVYEQAGRDAPPEGFGLGSWGGQANVSYKPGMAWNVWINVAEGDGDGMGATHVFSVDAANKHFKPRGGSYVRITSRDHDAFLEELITYIHGPQLAADEWDRHNWEAEQDALMAAMAEAAQEQDEDEDEEYEHVEGEGDFGDEHENNEDEEQAGDEDEYAEDGEQDDEEDEEEGDENEAEEQAAPQEQEAAANGGQEAAAAEQGAADQPRQEPASKRRRV